MKTLLILKPDAYARGLEGAILARVSQSGLKVAYSERRRLSRAEVEELYREHRERPFFSGNADFVLSGEVGLFLVQGGGDVVERLRELVGDKDPRLAEKGSIRGDFGIDPVHMERNLVHASSSREEARREIALLLGDVSPRENTGTQKGREHVKATSCRREEEAQEKVYQKEESPQGQGGAGGKARVRTTPRSVRRGTIRRQPLLE